MKDKIEELYNDLLVLSRDANFHRMNMERCQRDIDIINKEITRLRKKD